MAELDNSNMIELVAHWRREIVQARIKMVSERLSARQEAELWNAIEARERYIKLAARNFEAELEQIDREIEHALRRRH